MDRKPLLDSMLNQQTYKVLLYEVDQKQLFRFGEGKGECKDYCTLLAYVYHQNWIMVVIRKAQPGEHAAWFDMVACIGGAIVGPADATHNIEVTFFANVGPDRLPSDCDLNDLKLWRKFWKQIWREAYRQQQEKLASN